LQKGLLKQVFRSFHGAAPREVLQDLETMVLIKRSDIAGF
jgi:hypothetical protein